MRVKKRWRQRLLVKYFRQPRFFTTRLTILVKAAMFVVMIVVFGMSLWITAVTRRLLGCGNGCGTLDDFVELAPVQPHSAAFGAIVNFHALAVGHHQVGFSALWAFHSVLVLVFKLWFVGINKHVG